MAERRCRTCGALVSADAEWCNQCYSALGEPPEPEVAVREQAKEPEPEAPRGERDRAEEPVRGATAPFWPCPICDNRNPVALEACATCGTPFAQVLRESERRPEVDPRTALVWSLAFPGLGHWRCGRSLDGVARGVLFAWTLVTMVVILLSRSGKGGLGSVSGLFTLFAAATVLLYGASGVDAYRIASGDREIVSSRILLWGAAALTVLSTLIAALVTLPAVRGG